MIGIVAPIPNQNAANVPTKKTKDASGRRNGFWNLLTFSINGTVINPRGTAAIENTPSSLLGITRSRLNVGKKYHSGKISRAVANGSAYSARGVGSNTPKPIQQEIVPKIQTGKI